MMNIKTSCSAEDVFRRPKGALPQTKNFLGASHHTPFPDMVPLEKGKIHFDLLAEIFYM